MKKRIGASVIELCKGKHCCGCGACAQICPKGCITMRADEEGFLYPYIEQNECIGCHRCKKACPVLNNCHKKDDTWLQQAWAVWHADEEIRLASSSGGFFSLLAKAVMDQQGVVYGAAVINKKVKHIRISDHEEIVSLRGSKYVQSEIGRCYLEAEKDLKAGKWVLFTGTPCQIEALKSFLSKEYERLICMDFICHGVPSPKIWEHYARMREDEHGSEIKSISFRDKRNGWKRYGLSIEFLNESVYYLNKSEDPYLRSFLWDLSLRPSCYECVFKKQNRRSDITVADFWGVDQVETQMDDDKGTSLVIINTAKGQVFFEELYNQMHFKQVDAQKAIAHNPVMIKSVRKPKARDSFMKEAFQKDFSECVKQYAKESFTVKYAVKKVLAALGLLDVMRRIMKQ